MISKLFSPIGQAFLQLASGFFMVAAIFFVPMSESLKAICLVLALLCILLTRENHRQFINLFKKPWCWALLLMFTLVLLSSTWSPATGHQKFEVVNKYIKFLALPMCVVGFARREVRAYALYAFILVMFIICVLSMLKASGVLHFNGADAGQVFQNHIMTGFSMAIAAYLSLLFAVRHPGGERILMIFLWLLFTYQIYFINTGRTGYIIDILLMFVLMFQYLPWRLVILGCILSGILLGVVYHQSETLKDGVRKAVEDIKAYQIGEKNTSIGFRFQYHDFSKSLFLRHPWIGNGSGSYTYHFRNERPVKDDPVLSSLAHQSKKMVEPHSQYWFVAAEFGILGLAALFFFLASLWYAVLRTSAMRAVAVGLLGAFMVGSFSESLLYYSSSGSFFLLFMAMCLGESLPCGSRFSGALQSANL